MLAEHQREAVARALKLLATRGGVILADEAGLGKSYVAAEVMRRFDGVRELIVPAALVGQWRETLAELGVGARVLTHDALAGDPFVATPEPTLVVVDEAHAFRNPSTRRYAALARRTAAARVLLVTATPVCNAASDLQALLRIVARDDLLADAGVPSIDVAFAARDFEAIDAIVAALVIRRDRGVLPDSLQFGALERRVIRHPVPDLKLDALRFPLAGERALLRKFLRRRLESSEAALLESLRRQLRFYERALAAIAAGRTLPKRDYRRAFGHEEDRDAFQDVLFWDLFAPRGDTDPTAVREEMQRIESLMADARAAPGTKRKLLTDLLDGEREPALVFTSSVATARDLQRVLRCGIVTSRDRTRDAVLEAFRRGRLDVVVSTDMAAEGLNLQRAGAVIHYDLPWNPVKLDQRNGRAHRIGQTRETVRAIYFVPQSRDTRILEVISRKNRTRRRVLRNTVPSNGETRVPTLRPRLTDAAYSRSPLPLPETLARRHKAGIELLIDEMSREYFDQARLEHLLALVACEM